MAFSPRYNNRVGRYRGVEIENFNMSLTGTERLFFSFIAHGKLGYHSGSYQSFILYYSYYNSAASGTPILDSSIYITDPNNYNLPSLDYKLDGLTWGGDYDYLGIARLQRNFTGDAGGNFNFQVGTVGDSETDQSNLTIGNKYWISLNFGKPWKIKERPGYTSEVLIYDNGNWRRISTSYWLETSNI